MARWDREITLIKTSAEEKDEDGFLIAGQENKRNVFANKKSISQNEFYKAAQVGIQAEVKTELHKFDYEGETEVEMDGKRYSVLRAYEQEDADIVELTLTDLRS